MSKEVKRYADRDAYELDEAGNYYCRHVSAMTAEGLHSKSDIAAELGWRDWQIDLVIAERKALREALNQISEYPDHDTLELKRIARAALQGAQP